MPLRCLRFFTILLVALSAGLAFAHVLEQSAKMQYEALPYITLQKSLYIQWGPPQIGGFLEPLAIITTGLLAFYVRKATRELCFALWTLLALLLALPVVFFWLVAPANTAFMAAALPSIPPNWADLLKLGNRPRHSFRSSACGTLIAAFIVGTRFESSFS